MSKVSPTYNDEIDFISLLQTIWDGKWKIASVIVVSLSIAFGFNNFIFKSTFNAKTEIKPITSSEFDKYSMFNSSLKVIERKEKKDNKGEEENEKKVSNIFEITQKSLLKLYLEQIQEGTLLESGIVKYNLINKDDFARESDYKNAVIKFASEVKVVRPIKEKNEIPLRYILNAEYIYKDQWIKLLRFVDNEVNLKVKANIIDRFATIVSIQNQKKKFALQDLQIKIDNAKNNYDRYTKVRLAFLTEQAAIARKLELPKNTIASQRFNAKNTFVTNVIVDAPFYLRGYLAIEEEIKQIKNRKDKRSFIKNLSELEQKRRDVEQDRTIARAIDLFNKTPLNSKDFKATLVKVATTSFESTSKKNLYYALTIVLGGMIGVVYVLIAKAFANRKNNTVSS